MPDSPNPGYRAAASSIAAGSAVSLMLNGGGGILAGVLILLGQLTGAYYSQHLLMALMLLPSCALAAAHGWNIFKGSRPVVAETRRHAFSFSAMVFGVAMPNILAPMFIIPMLGFYIPYTIGMSGYSALILQQASAAFTAEAVYWTDKLILQKFYRPRY